MGQAHIPSDAAYDLLLRETHHRFNNDLQLVVSLLALQGRSLESAEARAALDDATSRVAVLARARTEFDREHSSSLATALRQVSEALQSQAEPRGILITTAVGAEVGGLSADQVGILALAVNELATNAIKYAFSADRPGRIEISAIADGGEIVITVDDDGLPMPDPVQAKGSGTGIGLVKSLISSAGGTLALPAGSAKRFEIRIPAIGATPEPAPNEVQPTFFPASKTVQTQA